MNMLIRHFRLHRRDFFVSVVAGLLVALVMLAVRLGLGPVSAAPISVNSNSNHTGPLQKLSVKSSPSDVVALMLDSQNQWQSLDLAANTIWYAPGNTTTVTTTVQIQQFARAHVEGQQSFADGMPGFGWTWITDGKVVYEQNSLKMIYTNHNLPEFAQSPAAAAAATAGESNDVIVRQPLAILMPTGLGDYIYPSGLMQRKGTVTLEGTDTVAGRPVVVIHWDGNGTPARYWVDSATGIILGAETYGGDGPGGAFEETRATRVVYDQSLPPETFAFKPLPGETHVTYDEWMGPAPK